MNDSLQIKLVKKDPYKVFRADIKSDEHIESLCKFLTRHKDKTLEIIINGKNFKFTSVAGRKSFVTGFKCAMATMEPYLEKFFRDLEGKLNSALSERDKAKNEIQIVKQTMTDTQAKYDTKNTVLELRIVAWQDQIAEWEDNCKHLKEQVVYLRKKLEDANHKEST
jgi:hypothetical protein